MTVTKLDYKLLSSLVRRSPSAGPSRRQVQSGLEDRLRDAVQVDPDRVPADVVTMNSVVLLKELSTGVRFSFAVVFPWEASPADNRLSVLSPLGAVVLGHVAGDVLMCRRADRLFLFRIEEILFQPEDSLRQAEGGNA
jgi:regulator of nucleoside diphosphate kinase